jgi:hypothetical protein
VWLTTPSAEGKTLVFVYQRLQAVDMNMEGNEKEAIGLLCSSGTVKDVHGAVKREMKTKVMFKLGGERHDDMWIDDVQFNVKELLIYLIKHFGA